MPEAAIKVEGLGKRYLIRHQQRERYVALRDVLANSVKAIGKRLAGRGGVGTNSPREEFWALKDVSFEVKPGERLGIIGRNGAGKSTLLKLLSRITEPTTGSIRLRGRVGSLLEVGTGFHPELTGRENIFLNGAIMGMGKAEIRRKFDEIVAFAEVEKFLDTPVKRYSSGMYGRLAFAVAANLDPEILVVDEVLAVGDAAFQKRCLGKMKAVGESGRTVLFVSHNMSAVQSFCPRCVLLQAGELVDDGAAMEVVQRYLTDYSAADSFCRPETHNGKTFINSATCELTGENETLELRLKTTIRSLAPRRVSLDIRLSDAAGNHVGYGSLGQFDEDALVNLIEGETECSCSISVGQLAVGTYYIGLDIATPDIEYFDRLDNCLSFEIVRTPTGSARRVLMQSWGFGAIDIAVKRVS